MGLGNKFFQAKEVLVPSKEVWVDKARSANYTENGSIQYPFRSVAAAIAGTTGGVAIHIVPAIYTEDITISRSGIHLLSHDTAQYRSGAQITGKFTIDIATGGSFYISGITLFNDSDHTVHFTGPGAQKIFANNCAFRNNSSGIHHSWLNDNTGSSEFTGHDCLIRHTDVSGGGRAMQIAVGTDTSHRIWKGNILINNNNMVAVEALGAGTFELAHEDVQGKMLIGGSTAFDVENIRLTTTTGAVLDLTSTFAIGNRMRNVQIITTGSPAIIGTGLLHHSGIVWEFTGSGFAPTLTLVATPWQGAKNVTYDPSSSIYPFTATNVQDALDEIAAAVAGGDTDELEFGNRTIQSSTTTRFLDAGITNAGAPPFIVQRPANKAGTLQGLVIRHNAPNGNGSPIVYTVFVNGIATAITTTLLSTDSGGSDLVNSVPVIATDLIAIQVTKAASIGSSPIDTTGYLEIV